MWVWQRLFLSLAFYASKTFFLCKYLYVCECQTFSYALNSWIFTNIKSFIVDVTREAESIKAHILIPNEFRRVTTSFIHELVHLDWVACKET